MGKRELWESRMGKEEGNPLGCDDLWSKFEVIGRRMEERKGRGIEERELGE